MATVAVTEQAAAAPQSSCHAGAVRSNAMLSQRVNDWPPTAGPAVSAAASVPPMMVTFSSRRLRGRLRAMKRSSRVRFSRI